VTAERILIVDDEPDIVVLVKMWLEGAGYTNLESVSTGRAALESIVSRPPACVLLDLGLPDISGIEVCQKLRALPAGSRTPVILFTAHKKDKLAGLEGGADYFVGKSGDPKELLATFEAVFRRKKQEAGVLERGELMLRTTERQVLWRGSPVATLTPKAFTLLHILVERGPAPVSRDDLYRLVEGVENPGLSRALDVLLLRLRKSLPPELAGRIVVVKNFGYCWLENAKVTGV
jgi:DNA-binding response OmpR family regulator